MTKRSLLPMLLLTALLAGCGVFNQTPNTGEQVGALTEENRRLQEEYAQLLTRFEELDEALMTAGFLEPQVVVESVEYAGGGETLQQVLNRGRVNCGINVDAPGLGYLTAETGEIAGFEVDYCRAIAAAVFGPRGAEQTELKALAARSRFAALQAGDVDVLIRNTAWSLSRDSSLRIDFAGPLLYDGIGILVPATAGSTSPRDLAGQTLCVQSDSTAETIVPRYFEFFGERIETRLYFDAASALAAYASEECAGFANDITILVGQRLLLAAPDDHIIVGGDMSREPLAPAVRHDDSNWLDVVHWVIQCTVNAEYLGVNQRNAAAQLDSGDSRVRLLLGVEGDLGAGLGLAPDFCYQVVSQVGNYADIYGRHLGPDTPQNLARGLNALYTDGGLLYPLPFR